MATRLGSPRKMQEALACVVLLAFATAAFGQGICEHHNALAACFIGPAITTAGSVSRPESASAAKSGVQPSSRQQQQEQQQQQRQPRTLATGVDASSPLARRILLRRALAKPKPRATTGSGSGSGSRSAAATDPPQRTGADVDNLFRFVR